MYDICTSMANTIINSLIGFSTSSIVYCVWKKHPIYVSTFYRVTLFGGLFIDLSMSAVSLWLDFNKFRLLSRGLLLICTSALNYLQIHGTLHLYKKFNNSNIFFSMISLYFINRFAHFLSSSLTSKCILSIENITGFVDDNKAVFNYFPSLKRNYTKSWNTEKSVL